jgi:uncharacterized protein YkwD
MMNTTWFHHPLKGPSILMRLNRTLSLVLAAAVVTSGVTVATNAAAPVTAQAATSDEAYNAIIQQILTETNAAREQNGLEPLTLNPQINPVAQAWSEKMASNGAMTHNPEYSFQIPGDWQQVGENVAYGYKPSEVVTAWMNSEGHRANILGNYTDIGLGYYIDGAGRTWYTQNFARYAPITLDAAANVSTTSNSYDRLTVRWSAPATSGTILGYTVNLYTADGTLVKTNQTSSSSTSFTGLTEKTDYYVTVTTKARSADLATTKESVSAPVSYTSESAPLPEEDFSLVEVTAPQNVAVKASYETADLSWTAPATVVGNLDAYTVNVYKGTTKVKTFTTTAWFQRVTGLTAGTAYRFEVVANATSNDGTNVKTAAATTDGTTLVRLSENVSVSVPQAVTAKAASATKVNVTWKAPATVVGTVTGYTVQISGSNYSKSIDTANLNATFEGLKANTSYTVKVVARAQSESKTKTATSAAASTTVRTAAVLSSKVAINAPGQLVVSGITKNAATVKWAKPTSVTGNIKFYNVSVITGKSVKSFNTTQLTAKPTGLKANTKYTVVVTAVAYSADGKYSSQASAAKTFMTKK